ncbi:class I SAM-dependent methyltransferase, partial [Vibrio vulnificus]|nr:class I SAM-dependent methyltransferase [Vibrio vulnificus]
LVAYVVPSGTALHTGESGQVAQWQEIYESMYGAARAEEWGEDFTGWNSSFTGEPIPLPEMADWRDAAVERVMAHAPRHVLEIGVGSGLLLSRIAPEVESYWATDFSAVVIDRLRGRLPNVELRCQPADDTSGLPEGHFDTVVLNSVVQYFPDADYLARVLAGAYALLTPGGRIVVGDVRHHGLLRAFHTEVVQRQTPDATPSVQRAAVEHAV